MKNFIIAICFVPALGLFAQTSIDSIYSDGYWRNYILHLPTGYNPTNNYPLVINMHGYGSNANSQMLYSEFNNVADTSNFIVVHPNGLFNAWNAGFLNPYHSGPDDVGFISELIDTLDKKYSVNTSRVYATGMSNGGFMSYRLACELKHKIAAIAPVTGLMHDSVKYYCQSQCEVPVLHIHGTNDATVNYNGQNGIYGGADSTAKYWANRNGCNLTPSITNFPDVVTTDNSTVTKIEYQSCNDSSQVILYRVNGGGHTWPGAISVPSLGVTNKDIKATHHIWMFFKQHWLRCKTTGINNKEITNGNISIFPNPTKNSLFIKEVEAVNLSSVKVYGIDGRLIKEYHKTTFIDLQNIKSGIYILTIQYNNRVSSFKFIKE